MPDFPAKGCRIELSDLHVEGKRFWTVCIDAFGEQIKMLNYMQLLAAHESHFLCAAALDEEHAADYPELLAGER
jgi:hypothetical protein